MSSCISRHQPPAAGSFQSAYAAAVVCLMLHPTGTSQVVDRLRPELVWLGLEAYACGDDRHVEETQPTWSPDQLCMPSVWTYVRLGGASPGGSAGAERWPRRSRTGRLPARSHGRESIGPRGAPCRALVARGRDRMPGRSSVPSAIGVSSKISPADHDDVVVRRRARRLPPMSPGVGGISGSRSPCPARGSTGCCRWSP